MTQSVKLPDPTYEKARKEANQRDISIGAVIQDWRQLADTHTHVCEHRLAGAEPTQVPEDAPRDDAGDPEEI